MSNAVTTKHVPWTHRTQKIGCPGFQQVKCRRFASWRFACPEQAAAPAHGAFCDGMAHKRTVGLRWVHTASPCFLTMLGDKEVHSAVNKTGSVQALDVVLVGF